MSDRQKLNRRGFLTRSALGGGGAAAAGTLAAPAVLAQSPVVVKMQTPWRASNIWQEMA